MPGLRLAFNFRTSAHVDSLLVGTQCDGVPVVIIAGVERFIPLQRSRVIIFDNPNIVVHVVFNKLPVWIAGIVVLSVDEANQVAGTIFRAVYVIIDHHFLHRLIRCKWFTASGAGRNTALLDHY